ncbi:MAG TPA: hypothetical protein IAB59_01435 [Candidatus Onthousia faecipullorum]|uniref:Lipoprotein n=1 Tax=Candidatus Onthousia faecipullorum TaxID=2840887 RepID=A0A9D1GAD3_9FIRM|nr:hypothetical protein [Candidatus Onthousia faecipullorum]
MVRGVKLFGILAVSVLFITGCGNSERTLTCTNSEEDSGLKMSQEVTMTFKDDKINYVKLSIDSEATGDTIIDNWDVFASMMGSQFEESNEDGVNLSTNNDADNHIFNVSLEIDLEKANEDALSEYGLDDITDGNASYEDIKENAEADGFTCK